MEDKDGLSPTSVAEGVVRDEDLANGVHNLMYNAVGPPPLNQLSMTDVEQLHSFKPAEGIPANKMLIASDESLANYTPHVKSNGSLPPRKPNSTASRPSRISRTQSEPAFATKQVDATTSSMANNWLYRGDSNTTHFVYEAVLQNQILQYGPNHSNVADAYEKLGDVLMCVLKYERAAQVFTESVKITTNLLGPDHLQVAKVLAKLGSCQVHLQRTDDAHHSFRDALKLTIRHFGNHHEMVANIQSQLACLYYSTGDYLAALGNFEDALGIYQSLAAYGTNQGTWLASVSETLCNIGSVQLKRKTYESATVSFSQALDLQRGVLGLPHPLMIATMDNLAYAYSKRKEPFLALATYREMLSAQLSHKGYDMDSYQTLTKLNLLYERVGDLRGACDSTVEAYNLQMRTLEPNDEIIRKTRDTMKRLDEMIHTQHMSGPKARNAVSARKEAKGD